MRFVCKDLGLELAGEHISVYIVPVTYYVVQNNSKFVIEKNFICNFSGSFTVKTIREKLSLERGRFTKI